MLNLVCLDLSLNSVDIDSVALDDCHFLADAIIRLRALCTKITIFQL